MDERTSEQRQADDELTTALERVARAYEIIDDDEILVDYVVAGYARGPGLNDRGGTRAVVLYRDDATGPVSTSYAYLGLADMLHEHQRESVRRPIGDDPDDRT